MLEQLRLDGRVAIVTGAGRGLGRALALALAAAGADVALAARSLPELEDSATAVQALGRRALVVPTDITDSAAVDRMVARTIAELGGLDILVNNAGGAEGLAWQEFFAIGDEDWRRGLELNLSGTFYACRAAGRHLLAQQRGKVINMSSLYGLRGGRNNFLYAVAKGGLIQLTRSLALTWAPHVQVNALAPGFMATRMILGDETPDTARDASRFKNIPTGRLGEPEELGPLAVYLASPVSDYVTGEVFVVDGGGHAAGWAPGPE